MSLKDYLGLKLRVTTKSKSKEFNIDKNLFNNIAPLIAEDVSDKLNSRAKATAQKIVSKNKKNNSSKITFDSDINNAFLPKTTLAKYRVLAKLVLKLIARTPVDEDYYYMYQREWNGINRKVIRKHTKDESIARDDWKVNLVLESGQQVNITTEDLKNIGCLFDDENSKTDLRLITNYFKTVCNGDDYKNFRCVNNNPHFDYLEFGMYNSNGPYSSGNDEYQHKNKEFHGSYNGYSVQAPRGIIRLTAQEFNNTLIKIEEESTKSYKKKLTAAKIKIDSSYMMNEEMKASLRSIEKKDVFKEKDILKALLQKKSEIPVSTDEEQKEFNRQENEKFKVFYKILKPQLQKLESKVKQKNEQAKRKKRVHHKNQPHNRTSIYGSIMCDKIKETITLIQEEAENTDVFEVTVQLENETPQIIFCRVENGQVLYNTNFTAMPEHLFIETRLLEEEEKPRYKHKFSWATSENFIRDYYKQFFSKRKRSRLSEAKLLDMTLKELKDALQNDNFWTKDKFIETED